MTKLGVGDQVARHIDASHLKTIDVLGPTIQFLTPLEEGDDAPCLMRGTIPPGVAVPLHSHADLETFLMVSGEVEALVEAESGFDWVRIRVGDVFHAPGGAKHAFRNQRQEPAEMMLVSTAAWAGSSKRSAGRSAPAYPRPCRRKRSGTFWRRPTGTGTGTPLPRRMLGWALPCRWADRAFGCAGSN